MIFSVIFLMMIHKISYYKVRVCTGGVETHARWLGWQFLNGLQKQNWQAGCWLHQCVLRNTLAGSKTWFLCPRMTLYRDVSESYSGLLTDRLAAQAPPRLGVFLCG